MSVLTSTTLTTVPSSVTTGQTFQVCWSVAGSGSISHTDLHWGTTTALGSNTAAQTGTAPGTFCANLTAPSTAGTLYVHSHASGPANSVTSTTSSISVQVANNLTGTSLTSYPASVPTGASYSVCWSVSGSGTISHTDVHWGTTTALGNASAVQTGTAPGSFCTTLVAPSTAGTVYVQSHASGPANSVLSSMGSLSVVVAQNDCGTGADAGGTHASANNISLPVSGCSGSLPSGDSDDYYQFGVTSGQTVTATMTPNSGADFDLCLYDPNGTLAGSCPGLSTGATESINHVAGASGNWRVRVMRLSGTGSYTLSVSAATNGAGTPTVNPADSPRLVGGESWVLQMDTDDHNVPSAGLTRDSAASGKHATLNGATFTSFAKFGNAYSFAGVNQSITVPEAGIAMPSGTLMMWVYPTATGGRLMYKQRPGVANEFFLAIASDSKVYVQTNQNAPTLGTAATVPLNQWTHIAVTWGSAGKRIYLNGGLAASDSDTVGVGTNYTHTMLGNSPNDLSTGGYNGAMDEVREYTTALSQASIQSLKDLPYVVSGATGFSESWENGLTGWTLGGGSAVAQDCGVGQSGCSLRLSSTSNAGVSVSRTFSVPLSTTRTASFWFRSNTVSGDTDTSVGVRLDTGNEVRLALTEGWGATNNGVNLHTPTASTGQFYSWPSADTWYQAVITLNPATDLASVQIKNGAGTVLAASSSVAIPAAAAAITGMSFDAVAWNGIQVHYYMDTVVIG